MKDSFSSNNENGVKYMSHAKNWFIIILLISLNLLSGCEQAANTSSAASVVTNPSFYVTNPAAITFESTTLSGATCDNSIFADYTLTMINIWATWCGPCIREIPDLQKVYEQLPEGVNLLGFCLDGAAEADLALQILRYSDAQYENIVVDQQMQREFLAEIEFIPTTIFVDSNGTQVGNPVVGVPQQNVVAHYLQRVGEYLKLVTE